MGNEKKYIGKGKHKNGRVDDKKGNRLGRNSIENNGRKGGEKKKEDLNIIKYIIIL